MRNQELRQALATESPEADERVPLEIDEDITRRDMWLFAPLIAVAVMLPLMATALLGFSTWHLMNSETAAFSTQPTTFASRWPAREMPLVVVR